MFPQLLWVEIYSLGSLMLFSLHAFSLNTGQYEVPGDRSDCLLTLPPPTFVYVFVCVCVYVSVC